MDTPDEREPTADEVMGMAWWNSLSELARSEWAARVGTGVVADAWSAFKFSLTEDQFKATCLQVTMDAAQNEALKIMTDAMKLIKQTGLEVSLITRCPNGAKWPVLMLEVGQTYADIEAVRNGKR